MATDLLPPLIPGQFDSPQQILVGETLVDDVPEPLCAGLGGKRDRSLLGVTRRDNVGDVLIECIDALGGEGEGDLYICDVDRHVV